MRRILALAALLCLLPISMALGQDPAPAAPAAPPPPPPPPNLLQVQVRVWLSETNEEGLRDLGNNLTYKRFVDGKEQSGSVQQVESQVFNPTTGENFLGPTLPAPVASSPDGFAAPLRPDNDNNPRTGIPSPSGSGMTYSIVQDDYGTLEGVFRAIETKSDVALISKPELLVVNGGTAEIRAGTQLPYQTVAYPKGPPQLSVQWKDIGVNMQLVPTILGNDYVELDLAELNVSDRLQPVISRGVELPVFSKRSQTGVVVVPDGQTLVIGGLSSRSVKRSEQRVPLLGKIPLLGMPFRKRISNADVTHLLVFVSPTIVDLRALTEKATSALEFWQERGSEWDNKERIEDEIKKMEHDL